MLKIGQNWGKIANYLPQCSTKIGTTAGEEMFTFSIFIKCPIKHKYLHSHAHVFPLNQSHLSLYVIDT